MSVDNKQGEEPVVQAGTQQAESAKTATSTARIHESRLAVPVHSPGEAYALAEAQRRAEAAQRKADEPEKPATSNARVHESRFAVPVNTVGDAFALAEAGRNKKGNSLV